MTRRCGGRGSSCGPSNRRPASLRGVRIESIERFVEPFNNDRDKTHFHIDQDAVLDPSKVWDAAGVSGDEPGEVLEGARNLLAGIARNEWNELCEVAMGLSPVEDHRYG